MMDADPLSGRRPGGQKDTIPYHTIPYHTIPSHFLKFRDFLSGDGEGMLLWSHRAQTSKSVTDSSGMSSLRALGIWTATVRRVSASGHQVVP